MLLERLDHVAADGPAVHLVGAIDQALGPDAGVPGRQRRIAAVAQGAVQAVWATDPTWGDLSDVLGLLITAFAVQAGGSVALGQWTGASRSSASATAPPSN